MATSEIAKLESRWRENPQGLTFAPLAEAYRKLKDPARALVVLQPGLERHPDYIPANIVLGRCHWDLNDLPAAERAFTHVLSLDGENVIALKALADIGERLDRYEESERWLEALLVVDRSNEEARQQLARVRALGAEQNHRVSESDAATEQHAPEQHAPEQHAPELQSLLEEPVAVEPSLDASAEPAGFEAFGWTRPADVSDDLPAAEPLPVEHFASHDEPAAPAADYPRDDLAPAEPAPEAYEEASPPASFYPDYPAPAGPYASDANELPAASGPSYTDDDAFGVERSEDIVLSPGHSEFQSQSAAEDLGKTAGPHNQPESEPAAGETSSGFAYAYAAHRSDRQPDFVAPVAEFTPEPAMEPGPGPNPDPHLVGAEPAITEPAAAERDIREPAAAERDIREPVAAIPEHPVEPQPDLVVTETMAEVYLRQGHVSEALEVYRELGRRSPSDIGVQHRIIELEEREVAMRPVRRAFAARETGGQSVAAFVQSVLAARPAPVAGTRWSQSSGGASDGGLAEGRGTQGATDASSDSGAPTRPAGDPLSLGSVFGEEPPAASPAMPENAPKQAPGVSFDEFFGGPRSPDSVPTRQNPAPGGKRDDDLDQFHNWLQGLKR